MPGEGSTSGSGDRYPAAPGFRLVGHTADFGIAGRGRTMEELFQVMARGLFALILEEGRVRPVVSRRIHLQASPAGDLLHHWLQEVNGLHQVHREVYGLFQVSVSGDTLNAQIRGEEIDAARHRIQHEVKGITWHDLELARDRLGWRAHVLVDV